MTEEINIVRAETQDIQSLVNFQLLLGKETENKELDANILNQAIKYLVEELQDQFYLVAKIGDEVAGCIMTVVQNQQNAWIQSVYVLSEHRKKGIFKRLYNQLCDLQKKKGIKMMYLYAEEENEKALATYHKLGMEIVKGMSMHGYDFTYNNDILPESTKDYTIKHQAISNDNNNLVDILKTGSNNHKPLSVFEQQRLVGYLQYFQQYSDWRHGRTINIMKLLLQDNKKQVLASILNYLKQKSPGLSVSAIRFFVSEESTLKEILEVPRLHYYVMSIDL